MNTPVSVSFEIFPPTDKASRRTLDATVEQLSPLRPAFVSVTCGAGGSLRSPTRDCAWRLLHSTTLTVAPHITCVDSPRSEVESTAAIYWENGIRHLVALRGDVSENARPIAANGGDDRYAYAADLVRALRRRHPFEVSVAAYPEGHPDSGLSVEADIENLKRKVDAGATRAMTQFFFDPYVFLRYRDRVAAAGLQIPIVPGILPILSFSQLSRFAKRCGAAVPVWLLHRFDGLDTDPQTRRLVAAHVLIDMVRRLRENGVDAFHFYTLNRAELTLAACHVLGLRPSAAAADEVA